MKVKKEVINRIKEVQKEKNKIYDLYKVVSPTITKEEFKRLKKALKEDKENKLKDWAFGLGLQLSNVLDIRYKDDFKKQFEREFGKALNDYRIILCNVLHFNEKCKFGKKRLQDVMNDLDVTVKLLIRKEFSIEDYVAQLKKDNIELTFIDDWRN